MIVGEHGYESKICAHFCFMELNSVCIFLSENKFRYIHVIKTIIMKRSTSITFLFTAILFSAVVYSQPNQIGANRPEPEKKQEVKPQNNMEVKKESGVKKSDNVFEADLDSVSIVLAMPEGGGKNGAAVTYDPVRKLYYASMAGNVAFPFAVFNTKGERISDYELEAKFDVRGLWYNKNTGKIEANGYNDFGIISYILDSKGIPVGTKQIFSGMTQPMENSVGVYDPAGNQIVYYSDYAFHFYNRATGEETKTLEDGLYETYADFTLAYTGIPGKELALLDIDNGEVLLFDIKTAAHTGTLSLPFTLDLEERMNFAYANGYFWFFDTVAREWSGYKMPKVK